jgi:fumarylacetoacetate (FAA) hydrolase family protein
MASICRLAARCARSVAIRAPELGSLMNRVNYCDAIPPWTFGIGQLLSNLQGRGLCLATSYAD